MKQRYLEPSDSGEEKLLPSCAVNTFRQFSVDNSPTIRGGDSFGSLIHATRKGFLLLNRSASLSFQRDVLRLVQAVQASASFFFQEFLQRFHRQGPRIVESLYFITVYAS